MSNPKTFSTKQVAQNRKVFDSQATRNRVFEKQVAFPRGIRDEEQKSMDND